MLLVFIHFSSLYKEYLTCLSHPLGLSRGHLLQAGPSSGSHSVPYLPLTQPYHFELPKMCLLQAHGKDSGSPARGPQHWGSLHPCYTDLEELSPSTVSSSHHTTEVPESPSLTAGHLLTYSPSLLSFSLTVELDSQGFPPTSNHPQKRSRRGLNEPAQDLEKGLAH